MNELTVKRLETLELKKTVRILERQLIQVRNELEDKCDELAEERRRRRGVGISSIEAMDDST